MNRPSSRLFGDLLGCVAGSVAGLPLSSEAALGQGAIRFDPLGPAAAEPDGVSDLVVADLDLDGRYDVVRTTTEGELVVALQDADGRFVETVVVEDGGTDDVIGLAVGDFDGDGIPDVAFERGAEEYHVLYGDGTGRGGELVRVDYDMLSFGRSRLVAANIDQDPEDEFIRYDGDIVVFDPRPGRTVEWRAVLGRFALVRLGDLDGDGDVDLVAPGRSECGYYGGEVLIEIYHNDGTGMFGEPLEISYPELGDVGRTSDGMALGDVDNDGDVDLVLGTGSTGSSCDGRYAEAALHVFRNDGTGRAFDRDPESIRFVTDSPRHVRLADLDLDGDLDAFCTLGSLFSDERNDAGIYVFENLGYGVFAPPEVVETDVRVFTVAAGDLDDDGVDDVVVGGDRPGLEGGGITLLRNVSDLASVPIEVSEIRRGGRVNVTVGSLRPGEPVDLLVATEPRNPDVAPAGALAYGGIVLEVDLPATATYAIEADSEGVARASIPVPARLAAPTVVIQAAVRRGPDGIDSVKSVDVTRRVLDP